MSEQKPCPCCCGAPDPVGEPCACDWRAETIVRCRAHQPMYEAAREEVALLRAEVDRLRTIIVDTAHELSPDCPDTDAYTDGSCSLEDTARAVMAELDNLKRAPMCEYPGCPKRAELECVLPPSLADEDATYHPLCLVHAEAEGYCVGCGQFWSGIEDFDRDPSGLCPNCRDQMVDDDENAEDDEIPF